MPKNRLQQFIEMHRQAAESTNGFAHEVHLGLYELGLILATEFDHKKDKAKTDIDKLFGGKIPSQKEILYLKYPNCALCGHKFVNIEEATKDHIRPKSKGGSNDITNLQLACAMCNSKKGNRWDENDPTNFMFPPTKKEMRYMLEQSNLIEGVTGKEAIDDSLAAFKWLLTHDKLSPSIIKKTHIMLMRNQDLERQFKGAWRPIPVFIGGVAKTEPPIVIDSLIRDWCKDIQNSKTLDEVKADHVRFEHIHPFVDGNGRMGRMLMNFQLYKLKRPLLVILDEEKQEYYEWFRQKSTPHVSPFKFDGEGVKR